MSDEPDRSWIIGSPILMGTSAGLLVSAMNPQSLVFSLLCGLLGALIGLAVGIAIWFWRVP